MIVTLFGLCIATLASASPAHMAPRGSTYPAPGPCMGNCWTHDPSMIQRDFDGMYFRFSTGPGVNTMVSPDLEGPWVDRGAALPEGSIIQLDGVDSMDIWVCESNPDFDVYYTEH